MSKVPSVGVASTDAEDEIMGHCGCGDSWRLASESVDPISGKWLDTVGVVCSTCGARRSFTFDITEFFEPRPAVWARRLTRPNLVPGVAFASAA